MKTSILKPGYLVGLKTRITGGAIYQRLDLESTHLDENGASIARWETKRQIADPSLYEAAIIQRGKASSVIRAACFNVGDFLMAPFEAADQLEAALIESRRIVVEFNRSQNAIQIECFAIVAQMANDDMEASKAIAAEARNLLADMERGIAKADPQAIREAANKAKSMAGMLQDQAGQKVSAAIEQAREAARLIAKRIKNAADGAAIEVGSIITQKIAEARFSFLDLDAAEAVTIAPAPRSIDMDAAAVAAPERILRPLEMDAGEALLVPVFVTRQAEV